MPVTMNSFKCANGHEFEANAKLRARCPECGLSTKRSFEALVKKATDKLEDHPPVVKPEPKQVAGPVLIRQGRPRMVVKKSAPVAKPKPPVKAKPRGTTIIGSHSAGLVKSHTIKRRGVRPAVTGKPPKTAIARGIKAGKEHVAPYWHQVADRFGI